MHAVPDQRPTVKAVIAEAKRLRDQAERVKRSDPFAKPYEPSDATARGLSQRLGPEAAITELQRRSSEATATYREEEERSARARARLDRQQRVADAERKQRLSSMTIGQRLDEALAGLVMVGEARAAALDANRVSGGGAESHDPLRSRQEGRAERLRERALLLVAEMEDELPRARRRIEDRRAA